MDMMGSYPGEKEAGG